MGHCHVAYQGSRQLALWSWPMLCRRYRRESTSVPRPHLQPICSAMRTGTSSSLAAPTAVGSLGSSVHSLVVPPLARPQGEEHKKRWSNARLPSARVRKLDSGDKARGWRGRDRNQEKEERHHAVMSTDKRQHRCTLPFA